jgi:hypothetical protein
MDQNRRHSWESYARRLEKWWRGEEMEARGEAPANLLLA